MIEEKLRVCESELKQLQNRRLELIALKYRLKNEIKMENTVSHLLSAVLLASYRLIIKN